MYICMYFHMYTCTCTCISKYILLIYTKTSIHLHDICVYKSVYVYVIDILHLSVLNELNKYMQIPEFCFSNT